MVPISPKMAKRWLRFNATRKGLLGFQKGWLVVYGLLKAKDQANKVTKGGEPPIVFRQSLDEGHWFEIVHEEAPPSRRQLKKAKKTAKKAAALAAAAEAEPTRRRVNRSLRAGMKAAKVNKEIGPRRATVTAVKLADSMLTKRQRRRRSQAQTEPLHDLERIERDRLQTEPTR